MKTVSDVVCGYAREIEALTAKHGRCVVVTPERVLDRRDAISLGPAGTTISPNGTCRLLPATDGWIAVNLPRPSDMELIPAWLGDAALGEEDIGRQVWKEGSAPLLARAALLGLPVSAVGETRAGALEPDSIRYGSGATRADRMRVVDLSSLWAGPLCGSILAEMGATVIKVESRDRPDTARTTPSFHAGLNGLKSRLSLDFADPVDQADLLKRITEADVVITSARPRAFVQLGLSPELVFLANPGLVWIAITGHGWDGAGGERIAFGDDAAAAGGLVHWTNSSEPRFAGDALADPLTGLAAVCAGLRAWETGGGVLVDASMSRVAAGVAGVISSTLPRW